MAPGCNCTDLNRITQLVDELVKEAAEEKAHLANQLWVIVLAYTFVILPWGLLYNVDFISEKWRTVHRTRFLGYVHMLFAIAPMPFIVFYAHLQQTSQDYKEMMAAVIAILMSLYHVVRTGWGLIQLASFSKWCSVLLQRMWRMRMITKHHITDIEKRLVEEAGGFQGFTENVVQLYKKNWNCLKLPRVNSSETDIESNTTDVLGNADVENRDRFVEMASKILRVNNTVVDNELGGTDMPVKVDWDLCMEKLKSSLRPKNRADDDESDGTEMEERSGMVASGLLTLEEKELCAVRWSGSFLSSYGEHWSDAEGQDECMTKCVDSLYILQYVTFPVNGNKKTFRTKNWKAGGPYGSNLVIPDLHDAINWLDHRKRELENVMGGFPTDKSTVQHRPSIFLVPALLYTQCIDEDILHALVDYEFGFPLHGRKKGWQLLLWQNGELPNDRNSPLMYLHSLPPFPWRKLVFPLWDKCTNWRVLQASVHADNLVDVCPEDIFEEDEGQPSCWFEHIRKECAKEEFSEIHYSGTILESVRSFLAYWMCCRSASAINPEWCPTLPTKKFQFSVNQDLIMDDDVNMKHKNLWRWECQSELHKAITDINLNEVNIPGSIELILLFILGLPGAMEPNETYSAACTSQRMDVSEDNSARTDGAESILLCCYEYIPALIPHDIKVGIQIFEGEGNEEKNVSIELIAAASVTEFRWEDWINSAMGFIKGADDYLTSKERDAGTVPWRKRTPRKVNLKMPLVKVSPTHEDLPDLRGDIQVWGGWPFFDIKIAQFEINEWMRASGCLTGYCGEVQSYEYQFSKEARNAEEGLMKISEWADSKWETILTENKKEIEDVSQNL